VPKGAARAGATVSAEAYQDAVSTRGLLDALRRFKRDRYNRKKSDPNYHGPRIVAEGDSWFEYFMTKDLLMWLGERYAVLSLAKAGDAWGNIDDQNELFPTIAAENPHIVMLSLGGNEVMGEIATYVSPYQLRPGDDPEDFDPNDWIKPGFEGLLRWVDSRYRSTILEIIATGSKVIVHGYDYPDPRSAQNGGQWLGGPLQHLGFGGVGIDAPGMWRGIINTMVDRFNDHLKDVVTDVANQHPNKVRYVRLLETIGTQDIVSGPDRNLWQDEIHGSPLGNQRLATRLAEVIDELYP
jgi:hypothetical protein